MKPLAKVGIVFGGYAAAFAIATAATSPYIAATSYIDAPQPSAFCNKTRGF